MSERGHWFVIGKIHDCSLHVCFDEAHTSPVTMKFEGQLLTEPESQNAQYY